MDMTSFHIALLLKLYCLFDKAKNKRKSGRGWHIFKVDFGLKYLFRARLDDRVGVIRISFSRLLFVDALFIVFCILYFV